MLFRIYFRGHFGFMRYKLYHISYTRQWYPRNHVPQRIKAECFLLAGSVFGWSFIEYILKEEGIFYNEYCSGSNKGTKSDHWTHSNDPNDTLPSGGPEFCTEALSYYQSIYTWMLIRLWFEIKYPTEIKFGIIGVVKKST